MDAEEVFDKMEHTGIYIVDCETFITYYENPVAQRTSVKHRIGLPCYSIHGNNSVCSSCPVRKANHTSLVNRSDLGMVFIVQSEEIDWKGHPSYLITVKKHETLPQMTDSEKSMRRMSRALQQSVNVYTEINLETMQYKQINVHDAEHYTASPTGDYALAFESMLNNEISPKDADVVKCTMSPEVLKSVGADSDGPKELIARYHLKDDPNGRLMQSRAIFMRNELPHYVVAVVTDVTDEMLISNRKDELEAMLNNIDVGVFLFEFHGDSFKLVAANPSIIEMMGHPKETVIGASTEEVLKYVHPDDKSIILNMIETMKHPNKRIIYQYRTLNTVTNEYIWLKARGHSVSGPDGSVLAYICYVDITESKMQEIQLFQNQQSVEFAQNEGKLSIWTYNIDKKLLIQQTPSDVDGHLGYPVHIENVPECFVQNKSIHPDDVEKYLDAYQKLADGAEASDVIYRIVDLTTGLFTWVHMFHRRIKNAASKDRIAAGFSMEINKQQEAIERYQLEQNLREQMYADAVLFIEYNLNTNTYDGTNNLSQSFHSKNWECPTEDNYIKNMSTIVDEPYLDEFVQKMYSKNLLESFKLGKVKVTCDYRTRIRTGKPSEWCRATATLVQRPDSSDVIAFIYIQNIEKEKQRQLALESSLTDGVESIATIRLSDGQARIIRSNSTRIPSDIGEHFTYDDNFVERSHKAVVGEDSDYSNIAARLSTVKKELETKEVYQYSVSMIGTDASLKRRLFRFRYLDDRKTDVIMTISDITSIYQEEQAKNKLLEDALEKAQKASGAKAEFYSRMSHDMRTPMNGILGMAELSRDETDAEKLKENIGKIRESGEYLLSLINDTLDIQRIESGKMSLEPKIVLASDLVNNVLDMMRVTAEKKGVNLKYISGNVDLNWYIRMDPLRLKQIFINLLSNAVKFTPAGGTVEWEFSLISRDGNISHDVIYVRDNGVGMSKEFMKNGIFKPFSQESNAVSIMYAGSGLGLSIAKSLVELMGGKIEVESELGIGTTFMVYLDFIRVRDDDAKGVLTEKKIENVNLTATLYGKKVLLAEDHHLNAEIVQRLLKKVNCEVAWAKNGQEALTLFDESPLHFFDVILMDIRMPVMDGLEATRAIRNLRRPDAANTPIIAITANAYDTDINNCMEAGMNAHISKPVNPEQLYATIHRCIDAQQ